MKLNLFADNYHETGGSLSSIMMNISEIVSILIFAVLIFIAAELYVIIRELSRGITLVIKEREKNEGKSSGQTINVNVAPTAGEPHNVTPPSLSSLTTQQKKETEDEDSVEEAASIPKKKPDPDRKSVV